MNNEEHAAAPYRKVMEYEKVGYQDSTTECMGQLI